LVIPRGQQAILLGLWCLVTGYDAHRGNITELLKNVTMAGGFFALATVGAGSISLFSGAPGGPFAYLP
jgi:putative oxidoreductase